MLTKGKVLMVLVAVAIRYEFMGTAVGLNKKCMFHVYTLESWDGT